MRTETLESTAAARPSPAKRRLVGAGVVLVISGLALLAVEAVVRIVDGYRLTSIRLDASTSRRPRVGFGVASGARKWVEAADALPFVRQLPVASGVDREWFDLPVATPRDAEPDADLVARMNRYKGGTDEKANYEWNINDVVGFICRGEHQSFGAVFNRLDDLFVFDPGDGTDEPPYRFLQQVRYPSGLRTNAFGWRGPDIPLNKPSNTIRIAFVGASTTIGTHGEPYSYPELVGLWLKRWADASHPGIYVDVINAGREGINSKSLPAIVRQEVVPLEPDLVYYDYDGANQFWPGDYVLTPVPPRSSASEAGPGWLASRSAIGARLAGALRARTRFGSEPPKPHLDLRWPIDLDERNPDLAHPHLPVDLSQLLSDIEVARREVTRQGGSLALTSIAWLVYPGMVLDPDRDAEIHSTLNTTYWPFSYAHMRRYLDFKTLVLRKYAVAHHLDFIDVGESFPRDARLFGDLIHVTRAGSYLQAWLVFNALVPIVERHLASHEWPRAVRRPLSRHPAFAERRLVPITQLRAACGKPSPTQNE